MGVFLLIKNPQASNTPRDECAYVGPGPLRLTAACAVPPCFFTCVKPLIVIQLRSAVHLLRIADLAPSIGALLPWRVTHRSVYPCADQAYRYSHQTTQGAQH